MAAEEEVIEEEKIVTATKKGAAVLDQWLPDHIKTQYHVLQLASQITLAKLSSSNSCMLLCCLWDIFGLLAFVWVVVTGYLMGFGFLWCIFFAMQGGEIYDAMLNQTNIGDNNNKFYVIQVLG